MIGAVLILGVAVVGPVLRWSTPIPIEAERISFTDKGVVAHREGEVLPVVVPWFDVKSLPDGWGGDAAQWEEVARLAHAARERRLRGDPVAAAPLYEALDEKLNSTRGDQAVDISLGRMQAALALRELSDAVFPWLESLEAGAEEASGIDQETGLHPAIIPVYFGVQPNELPSGEQLSSRAQVLLGYYRLATERPGGDQVTETLRELRKQAHVSADRDAGIRFVHDIVVCQVGAELAARKGAREALRRRIRAGAPGWMESWAHLAIGVSLMDESDPQDRERGVLECIEVVLSSRETPASVVHFAAQVAADYLRITDREALADTVLMTALLQTQTQDETRYEQGAP